MARSKPDTVAPGAHQRLPLDQLAVYHRNPRRGDISAIMGSLRVNGQYRPIVVNAGTKTGRANEVLAGNHTLLAMRELATQHPQDTRWAAVDVWLVDVDEDAAARIVAADNRTAELGGFDDEDLLDLLESLEHIEGTGYDLEDLEALRDLLDGPPDLDGLHDDIGDPKPDDTHKTVTLKLEPATAQRWKDHRAKRASDEAAMLALLGEPDDAA